MMTAVVVRLPRSSVLRASYRTNHSTGYALSFKLGGATAMTQLIAFTVEASSLFSISHC
jgi:hypothetical protein